MVPLIRSGPILKLDRNDLEQDELALQGGSIEESRYMHRGLVSLEEPHISSEVPFLAVKPLQVQAEYCWYTAGMCTSAWISAWACHLSITICRWRSSPGLRDTGMGVWSGPPSQTRIPIAVLRRRVQIALCTRYCKPRHKIRNKFRRIMLRMHIRPSSEQCQPGQLGKDLNRHVRSLGLLLLQELGHQGQRRIRWSM